MSKKLAVVLIATLSMSSPYVLAQDIAGIKLGSNYSEAKEALKNINSDYEFFSATAGPDAEEVGVVGKIDRNAPNYDEFVLIQNNDKIWFMARTQKYPDGQNISEQVLQDSLIEKFGPPSFKGTAFGKYGDRMVWFYDADGKQYVSDVNFELGLHDYPCEGTHFSGSDFPNGTVSYPDSFDSKCGYVMDVGYSSHNGLVRELLLHSYDSKSMYEDLVTKDIERQRLEKEKLQKAQEDAGKLKPSL